ncbi:MAG: YeeE/YedE thiosulfate transporter family protein [Thermoleophilia bacterium]|jgi:hypothetical protein
MAEATSSSRNKIYALGVVGFLAILSILYYLAAPVYLYIVVYMWFGFLYGVLQQYGRFCFASAWRDLIMVKVPRMFVGIMIGLMTLSIISAWLFVQYPAFYHPSPIGPHELVGGLLFGLGMVFAGGCATGSLYKTGEGNMISLTVLLSLSFAQAIFVALPFFDTWMSKLSVTGPNSITDTTDPNYIANVFHWPKWTLVEKIFPLTEDQVNQGVHHSFWQNFVANSLLNTIVIAAILMIGVYIIVVRKNFLKRRKAAMTQSADGGEVKMGFGDEVAGFWSMISSSKRTTIAAVLLGIIAAIQVFTMSWMRDNYDFGHPPYAQGDPVEILNQTGNFGQVFALTNPNDPNSRPTANKDAAPTSWPAADPGDVTKGGRMFDPGYWYITTQEAMFAGWIMNGVLPQSITGDLKAPHVNEKVDPTTHEVVAPEPEQNGNRYFGNDNGLPKPWNSPALLLSFGLILGASFLALWNKEFKWKFPTRELFFYAVLGGTIMGIGSRIALGCNIGAFYTRAAFGSPGGWLFFIGMGAGAYISAKAVNYLANKKMAKQMEDMDFDIEL